MPDKKTRVRISGKLHRQYAALPVRFNPAGAVEILLVTSRGAQRWIIPKGWPIRKLSPAEAAAQEAYEEAGVEGETDGLIGRYRYCKRIANGTLAKIEVSIFLLRVSRQLPVWPEQDQRQTGWFDPVAAAAMVTEPELAKILRDVGHSLPHTTKLLPEVVA